MFDEQASLSAYERFTPTEQVEILRLLKEQVEAARNDPAVFMTTCARTEFSADGIQRDITLAPHQHLLLNQGVLFPIRASQQWAWVTISKHWPISVLPRMPMDRQN